MARKKSPEKVEVIHASADQVIGPVEPSHSEQVEQSKKVARSKASDYADHQKFSKFKSNGGQ